MFPKPPVRSVLELFLQIANFLQFSMPGARLKNTSSPNRTSVTLPVATGAPSAGRRVDTKGRLVSLLKRIFFSHFF
jgi:hypothetical protein